MSGENLYEHYYAVIMAGGGGTRLWPLSRRQRPKQLLEVAEQQSLFQGAVKRLQGVFSNDHILVVTVADQAAALQAQCPEVPLQNYLIEPAPRGTASVIGLAAVALHAKDPEAIMAVVTADHYIGNLSRYHQFLKAAFEAAQQNYLVTLGVQPTYPATGYGYIQNGEYLATLQGMVIFRALKFKEKPSEEEARRMLTSHDHSWNSGMFIWKTAKVLGEFERQMPELYACLQNLQSCWGTPDQDSALRQLWPQLHSQTIDYGIMEHARDVVVIPAIGLEWSDVGSWASFFEIYPGDAQGNIVLAQENLAIDTHNTLIFAQDNRRLVVTIGLEDLVIVDTGDVLLVCSREQVQKVRQVVDELKKAGSELI